MTRAQALRILDANFNRSREGLRVCEDIARFALEHAGLSRRLKAARHAVTGALKALPMDYHELVGRRDSRRDPGRGPSALESRRSGAEDVFFANLERAKEALRALEETVKCVDAKAPARFKRIRFDLYDIEKRALPPLAALRHHRPGKRR